MGRYLYHMGIPAIGGDFEYHYGTTAMHAERTALSYTGGGGVTGGDPDDGWMTFSMAALGVMFSFSRGDASAVSSWSGWEGRFQSSFLTPIASATRVTSSRTNRCALHVIKHDVLTYDALDGSHGHPATTTGLMGEHTEIPLMLSFDQTMDVLGFYCFSPVIETENIKGSDGNFPLADQYTANPPSWSNDYYQVTGRFLYPRIKSSFVEILDAGETPTSSPPTPLPKNCVALQWYVAGPGTPGSFFFRGSSATALGGSAFQYDAVTGVPLEYSYVTSRRITTRLQYQTATSPVVLPLSPFTYQSGLTVMRGWAVVEGGEVPKLRQRQRDDERVAGGAGNQPTSVQKGIRVTNTQNTYV